MERDGSPWLAVANAAPFYNFDGGSVLFIDWDDLESRLAERPRELLVSDLVTDAVPTERFISALGWVPWRDELIVTRRLTEGGRTRAGEDDAYILDVSSADITGTLPLRDDPGDVVVDASSRRAFVLNYTDHSISVLSLDGEVITPIDLAPEAELVELPFQDTDDSGSVAELDRFVVLESTEVPTDLWTLDWLPGTVRVFIPDGDALTRASTGGAAYVRDPFGPGVDLSVPITDPFAVLVTLEAEHDATNAGLSLFFGADGVLYETANTDTIDDWSAATPLLVGDAGTWQERLSGPSLALVDDAAALFYAGSTEADPGHASIAFATQNAAGSWVKPERPLLEAPVGESFEHPFAQNDSTLAVGRLWFSHHDGTRYRILTTTFDDLAQSSFGIAEPTVSLELDSGIAAPVVRHFAGRYQLWAARDDGAHWTHVTATSADGVHWGPLTELFVSDAPYDPRQPPRLAVHHEEDGTWRVTGRDLGLSDLPARAGARTVDLTNGFSYTVASGHLFSADELFPLGRAAGGLVPGSHLEVGGTGRLYATLTGDDGRQRLAVLFHVGDTWDVLRQDLIPSGTGGNIAGVSAPVVVQTDPSQLVMFYAAEDESGRQRLRAATSTDGTRFEPVDVDLFPDVPDWASASFVPHSVEALDDGAHLLWFSGNDGSRWRIGALRVEGLATPSSATFTLETLDFTSFQLAPGVAGGSDDSGVRDPVVLVQDGQRVLWYSGFDGTSWSIGRAVWSGSEWRRRQNRQNDATLPILSATATTFAVAGVHSPVWGGTDADGVGTLYFAGEDFTDADTSIPRLGRAVVRGGYAWPDFRQPSVGDTLAFETRRGDERVSVIELEQTTDAYYTSGTGTTSLVFDADRGLLYVPSKLSNLLYVVDVREDVGVGRPDANAMDLETVLRFATVQNTAGFRGGVLDPVRDRLYLTARNPDAVAVLDTTRVEDDDDKEVTSETFLSTLALQNDAQDVGAESVAAIGGGRPLLAGDLLVVPNFSDNSVSVFDMGLGPNGQEVAHIPWVGENPHLAALSPDGRWAIIANYLGDVEDEVASSTLALLDLDPTSPTYLTVPTRIVNR